MGFVKGGTLHDINTYELAPPQAAASTPAETNVLSSSRTGAPPFPGSAIPQISAPPSLNQPSATASTFYKQLTQQPASGSWHPTTTADVIGPSLPPNPAHLDATPSTRHPQRQPHAAGSTIRADNVGYQLLRKHGWEHGDGLGAQGQGRTEPLPAIANAGRRGLGGSGTGSSGGSGGGTRVGAAHHQQQQPVHENNTPHTTPSLVYDSHESLLHPDARAVRAAQLDAAWAALPENNESQETKRKRLKQIKQVEVERGKREALGRWMAREFAEADECGGVGTTDTNPLTRRNHKLSATNPLL